MSFAALLTERAQIYAREAGQETWRRVSLEPLACRIVALSPREVEMAMAARRAEVTHRGRCLPSAKVRAGRRLVLEDGGEAYLIVSVTAVERPWPGGHLVVELQVVPGEQGR